MIDCRILHGILFNKSGIMTIGSCGNVLTFSILATKQNLDDTLVDCTTRCASLVPCKLLSNGLNRAPICCEIWGQQSICVDERLIDLEHYIYIPMCIEYSQNAKTFLSIRYTILFLACRRLVPNMLLIPDNIRHHSDSNEKAKPHDLEHQSKAELSSSV